MQIVFSYLLLLFLRTCFSAGSSSQAGPSNLNPQAGSPQQVNGLQELLRSCFDLNLLTVVGPPKDAKFTLEAIDEFRLVRLTFRVDGLEDGSKCTLIWDDASSDCGSIQSVYVIFPRRLKNLSVFHATAHNHRILGVRLKKSKRV